MSVDFPRPIVSATRYGNVRIHTFISTYMGDNIANATHIIESPNSLVLIDAQFLSVYASKFRAYADSLNKPIERLFVSHRHPDHWFGLAAFADVPIFALEETKTFIETNGDASRKDHWKMGDLAPDRVVAPRYTVAPGRENIDGVEYVFEKVTGTEIDFMLTIGLPELGVYIPQDLVYSGTHLYLTKDMAHWLEVLQSLTTSDYNVFLAGHGVPAGKDELQRNMQYLSAARQAIGEGLAADAFREFMIRSFPERKCPGIFDIYLPRLFGNAQDY